jgi:hypothetical protein
MREYGFIRNTVCRGLFGDTEIILGILFENHKITRTLPLLRWLFSGLSPRTPVFSSEVFRIGYVVRKVEMGQVLLRVLPPTHHTDAFICHPDCISLTIEIVFKYHT